MRLALNLISLLTYTLTININSTHINKNTKVPSEFNQNIQYNSTLFLDSIFMKNDKHISNSLIIFRNSFDANNSNYTSIEITYSTLIFPDDVMFIQTHPKNILKYYFDNYILPNLDNYEIRLINVFIK
jgi:hypothetical protein